MEFSATPNQRHQSIHRTLRLAVSELLATGNGESAVCPHELLGAVWEKLGPQRLSGFDEWHFRRLAVRSVRALLNEQARRKAEDRPQFRVLLELGAGGEPSAVDPLAFDAELGRIGGRDAKSLRLLELHLVGGFGTEPLAGLFGEGESAIQKALEEGKAELRARLLDPGSGSDEPS